MQAELLQNRFGVGSERFQFFVSFLTAVYFPQLYLAELVNSDDPRRLAPRRSSLATETWRISSEFFRKIGNAQNLLAMEICQLDLRGRREEKLVLFQTVHVCFEL